MLTIKCKREVARPERQTLLSGERPLTPKTGEQTTQNTMNCVVVWNGSIWHPPFPFSWSCGLLLCTKFRVSCVRLSLEQAPTAGELPTKGRLSGEPIKFILRASILYSFTNNGRGGQGIRKNARADYG